MPDFPITKKPLIINSSKTFKDFTVRFEYEGGYVATRPRATRTIRRYTVEYLLTNSEKATLEAFIKDTVEGCAYSFNWMPPDEGASILVRFSEIPTFNAVSNGLWRCHMEVEQV